MVRPSPTIDATAVRDIELDSVALSPATRAVSIRADDAGFLYYHFSRRDPRSLQLPSEYAGQRLLLIDRVQSTAVIDPRDMRLIAYAGYFATGQRMMLTGAHWGHWVDARADVHTEQNILNSIQLWGMPLNVSPARHQISLDFMINQHNPGAFPKAVSALLRADAGRHALKLIFGYPAGIFLGAQLVINRPDSDELLQLFGIEEFPILPPSHTRTSEAAPKPAPGARPAPPRSNGAGNRSARAFAIYAKYKQRAAETEANGEEFETKAETQRPGEAQPVNFTHHATAETAPAYEPEQPFPKARPERPVWPPPRPAQEKTSATSPGPKFPPRARPTRVPKTEYLSSLEVVRLLKNESDNDRRWMMIEDNLRLGRPERTYPLLLNFSDLIRDRVCTWPSARLKATFGCQPLAVLMGVMDPWRVNQIHALAEEHPEREGILDWLREREVERLLRLDTEKPMLTLQQARDAMFVDANAAPDKIKKIWRMQLGFLNADHGRHQEYAIHRRKDEIAKYLQDARNKLMGAR